MRKDIVENLKKSYKEDPYAKLDVDLRAHVEADYDLIEDIQIDEEYKKIAYKLILRKHVDEAFTEFNEAINKTG